MIFIFTGIQGSGKTTLAKAIIEENNFNYLRQSRPNNIDKYCGRIITEERTLDTVEIIQLLNPNLIIDRFHIDELVYANIYKRDIDERFYKMIDMILHSMGVILVYVHAPFEIIKERRKITLSQYDNIIKQYEKQLEVTKLPVIRISGSEAIADNVRLVLHRSENLSRIETHVGEIEIFGKKKVK